MNALQSWLDQNGLGRHGRLLAESDIDLDILPDLTESDLEKLGLSLGDRKRFLRAAAALRKSPAPTPGEALPGRADGTPTLSSGPASAERRQLTMMFCDLVGSTAMAGRLDPEELREVIGAYQACVATTVARFEGFVAKYMGDGVLAYFGYPKAHEHDAERAIRAGLALVAAVPTLWPRGEALQVRIGLATGEVVVGDLIGSGSSQEQAVVGDTPNLAARLQALAEPGQVVIAPETRRLVGRLFELGDLGAVAIKGFAAPVRAWRVTGEGGAESRFEALHGTELTPLVGRQDELELIRRRWAQARDGEGQAVLLSGEPGLGKSRLLAATQELLAGKSPVRLRYFCSPHHQDSALFPVIQQLERASGFEREDDGAARLAKLRALLAGDTEPEDFGLIAELLSLPSEGLTLPRGLSPQKKKERLLTALVRQLEVLVQTGPVLIVWEDVHWIDPSSRDLLDLTLEHILRLPVLLLVTFRPEFKAEWVGREHVTTLALKRLSRRERGEMVTRLTRGKALPEEVREQIVERTDGVPLFVEELTSSVLESGLMREEAERFVLTGALPPLAIPTTLQGSLMARLDRLAPVREVAQIGAAIGREFSFDLLAAVSGQSESVLGQALEQLTRAELVFARGEPPEASYTFKHALVQDAAYATLLKSRRQALHGTIARVLEERFPEMVERQPEVLAHHFEQAGLLERAVDYLLKAGQRAIAKSAMTEAVTQLQKGLRLISRMPPDSETDRRELQLQIALGSAMITVSGFTTPDVRNAFSRARELCDGLQDRTNLHRVIWGQFVYHLVGGNSDLALKYAREISQHNEVEGHRTLGQVSLVRGDLEAARRYFEAALAAYEAQPNFTSVSVQDSIVGIWSYASIALSALGLRNGAVQYNLKSLQRALDRKSPTSYAQALYNACFVAILWRDFEALDLHSAKMVSLAEEQKFNFWLANANVYRGYSLAKSDPKGSGCELLRAGIKAHRATGSRHYVAHQLAMLAEILPPAETESLNVIEEALRLVEATGERWSEAELHRLRGQIILARGCGCVEARECFLKALGIARDQKAKLWELRAATSLARLWHSEGRSKEALEVLAPVVDCFTEGHDMPDALEATRLKKELLLT